MTNEERQAKLADLARLKGLGERAYDDMYEAHSFSGASGHYSDAKECFYDAIRMAGELGMTEEADALEKRLAHIKEGFRRFFVQ